jgi:DUF1009 family protein
MMAPTTTSEGGHERIGRAGRVAVIAGGGRLPEEIAASLAKSGQRPFVIVAEGEVDSDSALYVYDHAIVALEDFGDIVPLMKRKGVGRAVLAGGIARRPHWRAIRWNLGLVAFLPKAISALARGDDNLLRVIISHIEANGIKVFGAHEIVPDLVAPEGPLTNAKPVKGDWRDLEAAAAAARAIGALDIGQAAVAIGGRTVALEGVEGTDGLLERVKVLRANGRIVVHRRGVLVKCAKPGQELRADLPTIGPMTVAAAQAAGLAGIAVESGHTLILDYGETVRRADELGLFLVGLPQGQA